MKRDIYGGKDPRELPAYTVTEAARCLDLAPTTLRQWVSGRTYAATGGPRSADGMIVPAKVGRPLMLSFNNLVEAHVLAGLRRARNIETPLTMSQVRHVMAWVATKMGLERPLLSAQFQTDGVNLFVECLDQLVDLTNHPGQLLMRQVVQGYLQRIERDEERMPVRLFPVVGFNLVDKPVSVDPRQSFGRPVVAGACVPTFVLADRYRGGDTVNDLMKDYRLEELQVRSALRYEREAA